jgi:hypothetical protein
MNNTSRPEGPVCSFMKLLVGWERCMLVGMCASWSTAMPLSTTASSISTALHCAGSRRASFTTRGRRGCGCIVCSFSCTGDDFREGNAHWGSNARVAQVYLRRFYKHNVRGNKTKVKGKIRKFSVNILMLHTRIRRASSISN